MPVVLLALAAAGCIGTGNFTVTSGSASPTPDPGSDAQAGPDPAPESDAQADPPPDPGPGQKLDGGRPPNVQPNPDTAPPVPLACPAANAGVLRVWENITPPQVPIGATNGSGIPNVVVNPLRPGELYISTYQKGIYKSSDCGSTWVKVNTGRNGAVLDSATPWLFVIDPITPNVLYASAFGGTMQNLYRSKNGGVDWDPLWPAGGVVAQAVEYTLPSLMGIDPTSHQHIVANIHANCKAPHRKLCFAESFDGGDTWRIVDGPAEAGGWTEDASPIVVNATTFMQGSAWAPLWLTTDSGATWKKVAGSGGLRVLQTPDGWTYMGSGQGVQRSRDLMSWSQLPGTPGLVGFGIVSDGSSIFVSGRYALSYAESAVTDGAKWAVLPPPGKLVKASGSYSLAIDTTHHILYSANQDAGLHRMVTK